MIRFILPLLLCLTDVVSAATVMPIEDGKLINALNGNGQPVNNLSTLTFGAGSPTSAIHLYPSGSPTTAAEGIRFGSDAVIYRSASGTLTLTGNLVVTGNITGTGTPVTVGGNNTWTGTNTFNGAVVFGGSAQVGTAGLTFSGSGAANTRTTLGVRPGVEVQAYSAALTAVAGVSPADSTFLVGNGSSWVGESGATVRTSLGLGTTDSPTFAGGTVSGTLSAATLTATTLLSAPNATSSIAGVVVGGTVIYGSGDTLTANGGFSVRGNTSLGNDGSDVTTLTGTLMFGADVNLYRSAADVLKTDDALSAAALVLTSPLGAAYGGTGLNNSALAADRFTYTTSTGVFGTASVTSQARTFLAASTTSAQRTALGLGTSSVLDVPSVGDAAVGEVVLGSDTRLTNGRAPSGSAGGALSGTYPNPTLSSTGATAGTYGSGTQIPVLTIGADGRITSISSLTVTGAQPTGTAGGDLTGSYPNPVIAANAVALGTDTTGDYVNSLVAGTGISITNNSGEAATPTIATAQDITTAGTPTFGSLTLTGGLTAGGNSAVTGDLSVSGALTAGSLSISSFTTTSITLSSPSLTGLRHTLVVHVDPGHSAATDTRTGLNKYDPNRPFATAAAAYTAAASGDVVYLHRNATAYPAQSLAAGKDIFLEAGAVIEGVSLGSAGTARITGQGEIISPGSVGATVTSAGAALHLYVKTSGATNAAVTTAGEMYVYAPLISTGSGSVTLNSTGGLTYLMTGVSLVNTGTGSSIGGSGAGTVVARAPVGTTHSIGGATLSAAGSGAFFAAGVLSMPTAHFTGATTESDKLQLGTTTGFFEESSNVIRTNDLLKADSLTLVTNPLAVSSGGTGATNATDALDNLGITAPGIDKFDYVTLDGSNTTDTVGTDTDPDIDFLYVNNTYSAGQGMILLPFSPDPGRTYVIKNVGTHTLLVDCNNDVNGQTTQDVYLETSPDGDGDSVTLTWDDGNNTWWTALHRKSGKVFMKAITMDGVTTSYTIGGTFGSYIPTSVEEILVSNTNAGNVLYLPGTSSSDGPIKGRKYRVRNIGTASMQVQTQNSWKINNVASRAVFHMSPGLDGEAYEFTADPDNSAWWVTALNQPRLKRTVSVTSSQTVGTSSGIAPDTDVIIGSSTAGNITITLPSSGERVNGMTFALRNIGTANAVTVGGNGVNFNGTGTSTITLTGNATVTSRGWAVVTLDTANSTWWVTSFGGTVTVP